MSLVDVSAWTQVRSIAPLGIIASSRIALSLFRPSDIFYACVLSSLGFDTLRSALRLCPRHLILVLQYV